MFASEVATKFQVVIDKQLDPNCQITTILQEHGYEVSYATDPIVSALYEPDIYIANFMRSNEADSLGRLHNVQAQWPATIVIAVTDNTMPGIMVAPDTERVILTYLCHSVDSNLLVNLVGGVMSSKYRIDLSEHMAVRGTQGQYLQQDQYAWDTLMLAGHECRDQLNRLVSASEQALHVIDDTLSAEMKTAMRCVRQNAVSMRCAINNYLNLTRLGNGKLSVHPALIDPVRDVLEPVIASYAELFEARKLSSQLRANRPGLLIWADKALLVNVYDNLIHDLLEFGESGGTVIFSVMERGNVDEFSVWSKGQAPDRQCLERLNYSDSIAAKKRNVEIGIYLANKIIEAHGGRLEIETRAGAWVNFTFTLPKREVANRGRAVHTNDFSFNVCL